MKAIRCREWGAPDVLRLEEAERPKLEQHQVRLRVRAAGVNFADSLMVGGAYQVKPPFPFTPGLEAAGDIVETGSAVDGLQAGQRVLAVLRNGGGYAEEIVLDAAAAVPIPDAMDFVTAAAFPVAYGTAHFALSSRPEDSHLRALPDPYVNLSIHTAPDVRPFPWQSCQWAKSVGFTRRSRSNQSRAPLVLRRNRLNLRRAQRMT